ncbi:type II secretion system inner membrane protein GspF [Arenimonas malthae]|nr:type II secretion system inner membrane protein GspF [Arenimonas malthae]
MAAFDFLALDTDGRERHGLLDAPSEAEARARLERRQWLPVRVSPAAAAPARARTGKLGAKALALVTRQLATLASVTPLEEALHTLAAQAENKRLRDVLARTHAHLVEGHRLSEAMGRVEGAYPPLYRAMVAAGESAGALPAVLERLADMLERQQALRSKLLTALIYPAALALTAGAVVVALMGFVVPKVVEQFESMGRTLPLLTRGVIALSELVSQWGLPLLVLAVALGMGFAATLRKPGPRLAFDRWLLRLPLAGRLVRDVHAALMARTLATVVASGLPLMEGLAITARTVHNRALREATEGMVAAIREGGSLSAAMRRAGVFPPTLLHLASSGEESGRLAPLLDRAADYLDREFHTFTSLVLSLLEPAIIVLLGGVIAVIVLSILLPILQFNTLVTG